MPQGTIQYTLRPRSGTSRRRRATRGGLAALGSGHGNGLRDVDAGAVRRGGQAGVVERRGAQGAVRERVVRMAPNEGAAISMRAMVLSGLLSSWEVKPRSAAELKEAAALFERTEALFDAL